MSSTGIRKRRTTDDRTDDTLKQVEDGYIRKAKRFTDQGRQETGNAGPGAIGGASIPGASYLPISGKYGMIGSLALNPIAVIIDDGRINITPNQSGASKDSSYILVTGQGSPDDLRFIDGATKNGQIFWLQGTLTQIINLKAATISGIDTISGLLTVTVITTSNHNLTTNDKINILATTNFNVNDVEVTVIDPTTFTYSAVGNITPESAGFVQNGNFVTNTGDDVVLDGTKSLNGVPMIPIIFDPTVAGNGAWRPAQLVSTGGTGVSFPIDFPEEPDRGTVTVDQVIDFAQSDRHSIAMTVGVATISLDIQNEPTDKLALSSITMKQDNVGGRTFTFLDTVANSQTIIDAFDALSADESISFMLEWERGIFTAYLKTGNIVSGGTPFSGNLSDLIINVNKDWGAQGISNLGALTGVTGIDLDGATALIQGVKELRFFDDDPNKNIQSAVDELSYNVPALEKHAFFAGSVEIARFQDIATVLSLDMLNHRIDDAQHISFDVAATLALSGAVPGIGFDSATSFFRFNVPTGAQFVFEENLGGTATGVRINPAGGGTVTADIINASDLLQIGVDATVPIVAGEFRNNGTDVTVFTGGVVKNLSDIGAATGANTSLSNLTSPTSINQDLLFSATGFDIGSSTFPVDQFSVETVRFQQGVFVSNLPSITSISGDSLDLHTSNGANINFDFEGFGTTHSFTPSSYTAPAIIVINNLVFNDSLALPTFNGEFRRSGDITAVQSPEFAVLRNSIVVNAEPAELSIRKLADSLTLGTTVATLNFQSGLSSAVTWADLSAGPLVGSGTDASFLQFLIRADNALINAVSIQGNDNDGDVQFLFGANDPVRLQPVLQPMGYFVTPQATDFLTNIGTSGTIEMPMINDGSPSVTDLNQAFGAFDGAFGVDIDLVGNNERIYVRISATEWLFFNAGGSIT